MKTPDWIALLEASYDISEPDTDVWLQGVLDRAVHLFESDLSVGVMAASYTPATFNIMGVCNTGSPELLAMAKATKDIAYTLGVSDAAVTTQLTSARQKLGLDSRAELAAFFAPSGARARLAEVAIAGEQLLVGAYPLCSERALAPLTEAERDVVALLLRGSTNQDIAERRGTSTRTIANQVQAIFRKLRVQSRVELATQLQSSC
jgi:DNA-binding CsgD family transcriptional regulator